MQKIMKKPYRSVLDWFLGFHKLCYFTSIEGKNVNTASRSEIRRWFKNKAILLNGIAVTGDEDINQFYTILVPELPNTNEIESLIMFPKSKRRCTLWYSPNIPYRKIV